MLAQGSLGVLWQWEGKGHQGSEAGAAMAARARAMSDAARTGQEPPLALGTVGAPAAAGAVVVEAAAGAAVVEAAAGAVVVVVGRAKGAGREVGAVGAGVKTVGHVMVLSQLVPAGRETHGCKMHGDGPSVR